MGTAFVNALAASIFGSTPTPRSRSHRVTFAVFERGRPVGDSDRRTLWLNFEPGAAVGPRAVLEATVIEVNRLLRLPENWDGEGARQIAWSAAVAAMEWCNHLATGVAAAPHVVPLRNGGLQMEWLVAGRELEVEVSPSGALGLLGTDADGNVIVEGEVPTACSPAFVGQARSMLADMYAPQRIL